MGYESTAQKLLAVVLSAALATSPCTAIAEEVLGADGQPTELQGEVETGLVADVAGEQGASAGKDESVIELAQRDEEHKDANEPQLPGDGGQAGGDQKTGDGGQTGDEQQPADGQQSDGQQFDGQQPSDAQDTPKPTMSPKVKVGTPRELGRGVQFVDENGNDNLTVVDYEEMGPWTLGDLSGNDVWYVMNCHSWRYGRMTVRGDVKIILCDCSSNKWSQFIIERGIEVAPGSSLTIYGQSKGTGILELESHDSKKAAIGVNEGSSLTINGGTIKATAKTVDGAGIGGNKDNSAGSITINRGTVVATSKKNGAGIGGGQNGSGGTITINGGNVTATSKDEDGAAIGGGEHGDGGTITINDGWVTATSNANDAAGIGGGFCGSAGTVEINGGVVTAEGGKNGAGIGSGKNGTGGEVRINGGTVTAKGGSNGAGVGSGCESADVKVHIGGDVVDAKGGSHAAGIGNGKGDDDDTAILSARGVEESGDDFPADQIMPLGVGLGQAGAIDITGGIVRAKGGSYAAGIGGSEHTIAPSTTIGGGNVTATGGTESAGIGGANRGIASSIDISGGRVTAIGADKGAGIGSGDGNEFDVCTKHDGTKDYFPGYDRISISGDATVLAYGGGDAAGIGTGNEWHRNRSTISISGGSITAVGGTKNVTVLQRCNPTYDRCNSGAGIGGGDRSSGGTIEISGGDVIARGAKYAAGIGGGDGSSGSGDDWSGNFDSITISGAKTKVDAESVGEGAGIGGGNEFKGGPCSYQTETGAITIKQGAQVTATSKGSKGAGIGAGDGKGKFSGRVYFYDKGTKVTATGGKYAAGIGGGNNGASAPVTFGDGTDVTAIPGEDAMAVGNGKDRNVSFFIDVKSEQRVEVDGKVAPMETRSDACRSKATVRVSHCEHESFEYEADEYNHKKVCHHCYVGHDWEGFSFHEYDECGRCKVCDYDGARLESVQPTYSDWPEVKFVVVAPDTCKDMSATMSVGGKLARSVETDGWHHDRGQLYSTYEYVMRLSPLELGEQVTCTVHCGDRDLEYKGSLQDAIRARIKFDYNLDERTHPKQSDEERFYRATANLGFYLQNWLCEENGWKPGSEFAKIDIHDLTFLNKETSGEWDGCEEIKEGFWNKQFKPEIDENRCAVEKFTCSMVLGVRPKARFYFTTKEGAGPFKCKAWFDGTNREYHAKQVGERRYCIEMDDLSIRDFDKKFLFFGTCRGSSGDGRFGVTGTLLGYYKALWDDKDSSQQAKDAAAAMYHYFWYATHQPNKWDWL